MMTTLRKLGPFSVAALLFWAASPALAADAPGFTAPRERIEAPFTNDKCLKNCHEQRELHGGGPLGEKRLLFVDGNAYFESTHGTRGLWCVDCHAGADPNSHPREGYPRVDCRSCHSKNPPEGVFPPDSAKILATRDVKAPREEFLKGDRWGSSAHGKAFDAGKANAPFCSDCHTAHYVKSSLKSDSPVYVCNLPKTCGKCHAGQTSSEDVGGALARWSIAGHGKGDFSQVYSESRCLSCHQGSAAHGEETVTAQACPDCHRPAEKIEAGKKGFHVVVGEGATLAGTALRYFYDVLVWGGLAGLALVAFFFGVTSIYRKSGGDGE